MVRFERAAQKFMVTRSLEWAGVQEGASAPKTGLDVGKPRQVPVQACCVLCVVCVYLCVLCVR